MNFRSEAFSKKYTSALKFLGEEIIAIWNLKTGPAPTCIIYVFLISLQYGAALHFITSK